MTYILRSSCIILIRTSYLVKFYEYVVSDLIIPNAYNFMILPVVNTTSYAQYSISEMQSDPTIIAKL